jgi:hypothetical protein
MHESKTIPSITIHTWLSMAIPKNEIQSILTYLAYKTNKPVTFRWYSEDEGYCENSVSVRIATSAGSFWKTSKTDTIRLGGKEYVLSEKQVTLDINWMFRKKSRFWMTIPSPLPTWTTTGLSYQLRLPQMIMRKQGPYLPT